MENLITDDNDVLVLVRGWAGTCEEGFHTLKNIARALGLPETKTMSHAIGRAVDKLCLQRHITGAGHGVRIFAPAVTADERLREVERQMETLRTLVMSQAITIEKMKARAEPLGRLLKLDKSIKIALEATGGTLYGVMKLYEVAEACGVKLDEPRLYNRMVTSLQNMRCINDNGDCDFGNQYFGGFVVPPATTVDDIEEKAPVVNVGVLSAEEKDDIEIKSWIDGRRTSLTGFMAATQVAIAVDKPRAAERISKALTRMNWPMYKVEGVVVFEF